MALAPEIASFGDGTHEEGETGLAVSGGGFGAFPGSVWIYANANRSGASDELTVGAWNDIQISGVEIPESPNNSTGTVYLFVQREDLAWSQGFAFTLQAAGGGSWSAAANRGGTAYSDTGVMGVTFLNDATPVPAAAFFRSGIAHDEDGLRYVALWPADDAVAYLGAIAYRADGAMLIDPSGTIVAYQGGIGLTYRGEVVASTSTPTVNHSGRGLLQDGKLCMSEVS